MGRDVSQKKTRFRRCKARLYADKKRCIIFSSNLKLGVPHFSIENLFNISVSINGNETAYFTFRDFVLWHLRI